MRVRDIFQEWRHRQNNGANLSDPNIEERYNPARVDIREEWINQCDSGDLKNVRIFGIYTQGEHHHTRTKAFMLEFCFISAVITIAFSIFYRKNHKPLITGVLAAASTYFYSQICTKDKKIYRSRGDLMVERLASDSSQFYKIPQQTLADYINIFIKVPREPHSKPNKFMLLICALSVVATATTAALYHKQGKSFIIGILSASSMFSLCNSLAKSAYQPPADPLVESFLSHPDVQFSKQDRQHIANYIKNHNQTYDRC